MVLIRFLLFAAVLFEAGCSDEFQDALDKGRVASRNMKYAEAARYFEKAVTLKQESVEAREQLALTCAMQYIPGVSSADNSAVSQKAEAGFRKVLELASGEKAALASLGQLMYEESLSQDAPARFSKLDEATHWLEKLKTVSPQSSEVSYFLGVIDWEKAHPQSLEARRQLQMKSEDSGPLPNEQVRRDLQTRIGPLYDDAIQQFTRALQIDADYGEAMAYLGLCLRGRAILATGKSDYDRDINQAEAWLQKGLEALKQNKSHQASKGLFYTDLPGPPPPPLPPPPA